MTFIPSILSDLTPTMSALLCDVGRKLTGFDRRSFMALVPVTLFGGSASQEGEFAVEHA
jgi:hypothetical protein